MLCANLFDFSISVSSSATPLPGNCKCVVCKKSCWSSECLAGMRCEWCGITVSSTNQLLLWSTVVHNNLILDCTDNSGNQKFHSWLYWQLVINGKQFLSWIGLHRPMPPATNRSPRSAHLATYAVSFFHPTALRSRERSCPWSNCWAFHGRKIVSELVLIDCTFGCN